MAAQSVPPVSSTSNVQPGGAATGSASQSSGPTYVAPPFRGATVSGNVVPSGVQLPVPSGAARAQQQKPAILSHAAMPFLTKTNSGLEKMITDNPGLRVFLEANKAALHVPKSGDVQTDFTFPMWTHSPQSGSGMTDANRRDIIIVWQEVPGSSATVSFGGQTFRGEIIGVQQVNLRDGKEIKPTPYGQNAKDGYFWDDLKVLTSGPKGQAANVKWAVVDLDAQGRVRGGGFPSGWVGRTWNGVHGTRPSIPMRE
jgi:hypothetical protein